MALTRNFLKSMELTEEQASTIINEHVATVDAFKEQLSEANNQIAELKKNDGIIESLKKEIEDLKNGDWEAKYNNEHTAFENYKKEIDDSKLKEKVKNAYKKLLVKNNIGDKHIDSILKVTDFSDIKLDDDGKIIDEDKYSESISEEWAGFITSKKTKGADVDNPPQNTGGRSLTREEISKIEDPKERQKAIAENLDLYSR